MKYGHDGKGQPYIEWEQGDGRSKRAWIQHRDNGRYLNVGPPAGKGIPADFPILSDVLPDEQILQAFVQSICAITGCPLSDGDQVRTALQSG